MKKTLGILLVVCFLISVTAVSVSCSLNPTDGAHALTVDCKDTSSNSAVQKSVSFTLDTVAPSVTVTSHTNGQTVNTAAINLAAIPDWERHLAVLLGDRDEQVQIAAIAAAVHLRSAVVAKVLMRSVDPCPRSQWKPTHGIGGYREADWWTRIQERQEWLRELSAMALIEMKFEEAIPQLGRLLLEDPIPGYVHQTECTPLAVAICGFLRDSASPKAQAALAAYDQRIGSPGAWRVLCDPAPASAWVR